MWQSLSAQFNERGEILVSTRDTGCLDGETLRDAKAHPDKYPDLLVRIAGFNAIFAKLSPAEQDELIARAEWLMADG